MKNKFVKMLALLTATTVVAAGVIGCGSNDSQSVDANADAETGTNTQAADNTDAQADENADAAGADLSGTVTLAGSTSMEKLANAMAEAFMEKYPNVKVTPEFTGSSAGLESLAAGSVDIGDASRALTDEEKASGAVENIVAIDGIATITDTENTVTDLKTEDLAKIYKGEITNWKDLGGPDESIVVIGREAGSGTRDAFEELVDVKDACKYAQELDSTGAVLAKVAATPGSIGYVSLDVVDDTVSALKLNSVEPTEENILKGDYVLQRPFVMATKGEISEQSDTVKAFFDFINSDEGKAVIQQVGLIIPQ
ncbi:MAG: phosphate ABC transporter substrate-binding protein [Agathobacter sp.]